MINTQVVEQKLQDQALQERMIEDSIFILASVEYTQNLLEQKLLEIDTAESDYRFDDLPGLRDQVIALLTKLRLEKKLMEYYMVKYKRLVDEKKTLLSRPVKKRAIYLRGVPPHPTWQGESKGLRSQAQANP